MSHVFVLTLRKCLRAVQDDFGNAVRKLDGLNVVQPVRASFPPAYGGEGASHLQQLQAQMQYDALRKKQQKEVAVCQGLLPCAAHCVSCVHAC